MTSIDFLFLLKVTGRPFEASIKLHKDQRLTLLGTVLDFPLPIAEFAFLYASHAADGIIADEGLHLAAAMKFCWIPEHRRDDVVWDLLLLSSKSWRGTPYHERSAQRDSVQRRDALERWANFVPYGA